MSDRERLRAYLKEIENHCPCGARPESPRTHPHVGSCPVYQALALVDALLLPPSGEIRKEQEEGDLARVDTPGESIDSLTAAENELARASAVLDELVAPDESKPLDERIRDEFHDFQMLLDHLTRTYEHFSAGRISKPNTLPEEVFAVAEEVAQGDWEAALADEKPPCADHPKGDMEWCCVECLEAQELRPAVDVVARAASNQHELSTRAAVSSSPPCVSGEATPTQEPDWIKRVAADIHELNPDYRDFEGEVVKLIRAALASALAEPSPVNEQEQK